MDTVTIGRPALLDATGKVGSVVKRGCWMIAQNPPCFILGGRYGDSIQMLPCFLEIFKRTGKTPAIICSQEYANVYEGVSYVKVHPVHEHWYAGMPKFKQVADNLFGGGIVVQFWQEPPQRSDTIGFNGKNWITLQCHGASHGVDMHLDPNYGCSMARRAGFSKDEWLNLPLVFDRRNTERENQLFLKHVRSDKRPLLIYNFEGVSSQFAYGPEYINAILRTYGGKFKCVDLGKIRASRIYDILGLYDRAVGLITIDTSTLHLALGSKVPYVAFTVDGWTSSVPKGNVIKEIKYSQGMTELNSVMSILEKW